MKKALLVASILFVSVVSTACINNFAVQELNNKAKIYLDEGNYQEAIGRLKASIDLDDTIFETHYNLAVAYTKADDYVNAMQAYIKAAELRPDFANTYYSLAVCEENLAKDLTNGMVKIDDSGNIAPLSNSEVEENDAKELSDEEKVLVVDLLNKSIANYRLYIEKSPEASDKNEVEDKVTKLQGMADEYVSENSEHMNNQ